MAASYLDRALLAFMRCHGLDAFALKALRHASHLLGLAIGTRLAEMRERGEPFLAAASKCEEQSLLLRLSDEACSLLAARWDKLPAKHRPHYTPEQRYRILRIKDLMALSRTEVAGVSEWIQGRLHAGRPSLRSTPTRRGSALW